MGEYVISDLCERYGVTQVWVTSSTDIPDRFGGPMGQGCNPKKKLVYYHEGPMAAIEHYLHELVHVICQTPWWPITKTPEDILLFQFERALANATLEDWAYAGVVEWQHQTAVAISGRFPGDLCLGDIQPYENQPFWALGYAICRRVGLLDAKNRPTYRWPDWSRIEDQKDTIFQYFRSKARSPLPVL